MRPLRRSLILLFLIGGFSLSALAQRQDLTDAQRVDLAGSVKSVSTETTRTDVVWSQPGGPALIIPVWCQECEFDPNGNRTKFGQMFDGRFQGEIVHLLFDGQGRVTERIAEDASSGETIRHEIVGPFGNMEESHYQCHSDGNCERARVRYVYLDAKRRNPQSVEWRDDSGGLLYGAYYDYEIDAQRNWTHRVIWVWSRLLGERKVYETDSRTISYWPQ